MTTYSFTTNQAIKALVETNDALVVHELLLKEYGYVSLEGTSIAVNGAYFIHPVDWPKPDISSAKLCWPAMEKVGLQFIGLKVKDTPNTNPHYDGLINGMACELKHMHLKSSIKTQQLKEDLLKRLSKCNKQGAEIGVIVIDSLNDSFDKKKIEAISNQIKEGDRFLSWQNLKEFYILLK